MTTHVVSGYFGSPVTVATSNDEIATGIDLLEKEDLAHGVGHALEGLREFQIFPSEIGLDLFILASLVHAADTRVSRRSESQDTWTREYRLIVPVSAPGRWSSVSPLIEEMLDFLTGDRWRLDFMARPSAYRALAPVRPVGTDVAGFSCLSLFSGGLDSLIGAIDLLESGASPLLISHAGDGAVSDSQRTCYEGLKAAYGESFLERIRLWMSFRKGLFRGVGSESSTRARSFLFIALGVLAGTGLGSSFTLRIPENGLIALNVPLDVLRLGACSTRTTHPFYLAKWNELLRELGIMGRVLNPYWNKTKGEMVEECANQDVLRRLVAASISCSSPAKGRFRKLGIGHCGYCLPCIIRRAAIEKAWGRGKDPTSYAASDLKAKIFDTRRAEGRQIRSFQMAVARLQAVPALARVLIHKPGSLASEVSHLDELVDVYRRGMAEVGGLLEGVRASSRQT